MPASVIDQLVVTLGLDAKDFKQGTDTAKRGLGDFASGVSEAGESVVGLALKLGGLAAALIGVGDLLHYMKEMGEYVERAIHFPAQNLGEDQRQLLIWSRTAVLAGGSAADAAASMNTLQQSIFNLRFKGQFSENLLMLQRLGVQFMTAGGQMRDFKAIALDTTRALENAGFDNATRYQYAVSAGFSGGIATAIASGTAGFSDLFDKATKATAGVTDKQLDALTKNTQALQALKMSVDDEAIKIGGSNGLTQAVSALTTGFNTVIKWIQDTWQATTGPNSTLRKVENAFGGPATGLAVPGGTIGGSVDDFWRSMGAALSLLPKPSAAVSNAYNQVFASALDVPQWMQPGQPPNSAPKGGTTTVDIGTIVINTKAKDANGIAADIKPAIQRKFATSQADSGVTQ